MNQSINMQNYEDYMSDYLDGKLDDSTLIEFIDFLDNHPEIKNHLDNLLPNFSEDNVSKDFCSKFSITNRYFEELSDINSENSDDWFIAFLEGDLTNEQKANVLLFLEKNPNFTKDFELISQTKISTKSKSVFNFDCLLRDEETGIQAFDAELIDCIENKKQPDFQSKDYELYKRTIQIPDLSIEFKQKNTLLKDEYPVLWMGKPHRIANVVSSIAAAVLIGFFNPLIIDNVQHKTDTILTQNNEISSVNNKNSIVFIHSSDGKISKETSESAHKNSDVSVKISSPKSFYGFSESKDDIIFANADVINFSDLEFAENKTEKSNSQVEEIITPMPVLAYAKDKVKSFLSGQKQQSELEINWQSVAVLGMNKISEFTNNDRIQALAQNQSEKNPIFILKKR